MKAPGQVSRRSVRRTDDRKATRYFHPPTPMQPISGKQISADIRVVGGCPSCGILFPE